MARLHVLLSFLLLSLLSCALAAPPTGPPGLPGGPKPKPKKCKSIERRKEWRQLTIPQRVAYTTAVKCLNTLPSHDPARGAVTRFDDFHLTHVLLTPRIHFVGQFLPWHRHYVTLYSKALREECGYKGPTPYWDWTIEADSSAPFAQSSLFDPVHGFGGDGVAGTYTLPPDPNGESEIVPFPGNPPLEILWKGCVMDGPFRQSEFTLHIGPGRMFTEHCLVRNLYPEQWKPLITTQAVNHVLSATNFEEHRTFTNDGPHLGGHAIFGGVMTNGFSSPGDPLFYLHHAALDRVWWLWQTANPSQRLTDISGPTEVDGSVQVTLDFPLDFPVLGNNITIRDTMDASLEPNCFIYE